MLKKFLTTDEIHEFYGVDEDTIQRLVDSGDLQALADRGAWKYRREDLEVLIKTGKLHPTKELPEVGADEIDSDPDFPIDTPGSEKVEYMELDESALAPTEPKKATSSSDVVVLEPTGAPGSDSDIKLREPSRVSPAEEAAIPTDVDATVLSAGSGSVLDETSEESVLAQPDSDSGISLVKEDSGITLAAGDSGISLERGDSGISLEKPEDRAASVLHDADTEFMDQLGVTPDQEFKVAEESGIPQLKFQESDSGIPKLFEEKPGDATTVLPTEEEEVPLSFSGKVEAGESVQDLEVVEELDEDAAVDVAEAMEEEEILEASDEVFGEEFAEEVAEGEELPAAPGKVKPSEPSWGMMVNLSVIAASVLVVLNGWLIVEGLATMWTGAPTSGLASSIISTLAGLM